MPALDASAVAALLVELGRRTALTGDNYFRAKAYLRAADTLSGLIEPLDRVIAENRLRQLPGIGDTIADIVTKLHNTGTHPLLEKLRRDVPEGVLDMLSVPGLDQIFTWLDANCGSDRWIWTPSSMRGVMNDALAVYFADVTIASAFVARWCTSQKVEIVDGVYRVRDDEPRPRIGAGLHKTALNGSVFVESARYPIKTAPSQPNADIRPIRLLRGAIPLARMRPGMRMRRREFILGLAIFANASV